MYKGNLTPSENGGFNLVMKEQANGPIDIAIKLGISALCGAATYLGSALAEKIVSSTKKKPKNKENK